MKNICNLSYNNFKTKGEVIEGLPLHQKDLLRFYPLDKDTYNVIPEVKIYVENDKLIKEGIKANDAITLNDVTYENNLIKFKGVNTSYLMINSSIFNSHKNYKIDIEYVTNKTDKEECILFIGDKNNPNNFYNIFNDGKTLSLNMKKMNRDEKISYNISKVGESVPGRVNKLSLCSKNNTFFVSYFNDEYHEMFHNSRDKNATVKFPIDDSNYFNGYIKSVTIYTYDDLNSSANKIQIEDYGYLGFTSANNIYDELKGYNVGWELNKNYFFEKTDKELYGHPIYRIKISPTDQGLLDKLIDGWSVGVCSKQKVTLAPNQDACSYIAYRPLTFIDSAYATGSPSNNIKWTNGKIVDLNNGWKLAYKFRNPNIKDVEESDYIHWTFSTPEIKLNEELIVEVCFISTIKDTQIPSSLVKSKYPNISNNKMVVDPKDINDNINEFSLSYDLKVISHTNNVQYPFQLWLGTYPGSGVPMNDWVALYYNGLNWGNKTFSLTGLTVKDGVYKASKAIENFNNYIGHDLKAIMSYNKTTQIFNSILYNKTTCEVLNEFTQGDINFTSFNKMFFNEDTNDIIKNFAIFKKSFTIEEMKSMCRKDFKILEDGSFNIDNLEDFDFNFERDNYYIPLDNSTESICTRLKSVETKENNKVEYLYEDGGLNAGAVKRKAYLNLTPIYKGPLLTTELGWDKNLHSDAIDYPNWGTGYNAGVKNPSIGYHAKWVNEGPTRNSCMKFINYNSVFGEIYRWLGINREITNFFTDSKVVVGDTIQISFKAKSMNSTFVRVGVHRTSIATGSRDFYKIESVYLTKDWDNYTVEIPVDPDWKMDGTQVIYFYGYENYEDIIWVSDVSIAINSPKIVTTDILKVNQNLDLSYNLTTDANLDWSKPWHISFWRKPISKDFTNDVNAWSLGVYENRALSKGYIFTGIEQPNMLSAYIDGTRESISIDENLYFNNWGYVTIDYDGQQIRVIHRGEHYYLKHSVTKSIQLKDYFDNPDQISDLFLGSYKGVLNNSTMKDLIILKNKCLSIEEEDKIFKNLMRYDYKLKTRINIKEE